MSPQIREHEEREQGDRKAEGRARRPAGAEVLRLRSGLLFSWFSWYAGRYLARHFHAVRLARDGRPPALRDGPLIVVLNHPSWWDPMVCILLTSLFPDRKHFAPMEAKALQRYRFFQRLGFFPVELGSVSGAAGFLEASLAILSAPGTALWVTAQGEFVDPRERPVRMRPGVAHLARRIDRGTILPLALEYPFWEERFPEALARFGAPLEIAEAGIGVKAWTARMEAALERAQDDLAAASRRRDPAAFDVLRKGKAGVGGIYDAWRSFLARLRGRRFVAAHGGTEGEGSPPGPGGPP